MTTNINNNIKEHYFKRYLKLIRCACRQLTKPEAKEIRDKIFGEIEPGKPNNDIYLPTVIDGDKIAYDLEYYPYKFIRPTFFINKYLEEHGKSEDTLDGKTKKSFKLFSVVPLRRGFVPQYIHIDTTALKSLIATEKEYSTPSKKIIQERKEKEKQKQNAVIEETDIIYQQSSSPDTVGSGKKSKDKRKGCDVESSSVKETKPDS